MLLTLKIDNCAVYNSEVEFSMRANMHYRRFPNNTVKIGKVNVLKTAVILGPNNTGKTSFVRCIAAIRDAILNRGIEFRRNIFSDNPIVEVSISFIEGGKEYFFEIKYDADKQEYVYERFGQIVRDVHKNCRSINLIVRDTINKSYSASNEDLVKMMKVAGKKNLLIYVIDTESFQELQRMKEVLTAFASTIDVVDMNNIPIQKTIEMLKQSEEAHEKIAGFIRNADLLLDDFRYLRDDELEISFRNENGDAVRPQENAIMQSVPVMDMLHLASVYKGTFVPSMLYDSTGTKKMAALASYVIDALEKGRILVVDELDNSLHFRLTRAIVALFNNELNQNAQLIATAHDVSLLDCHTLLRKEQIWFSHKDKENTYLYSLADFTADKDGVRDTSDLIEKYRSGIFGALPEPDLFQSLLEVKGHG